MEIFEYVFFRNALIGLILVGIASAIIGTYVATRRMLFVAGGVTHASFGGLGLGYYLGLNPIASAGIFAVAAALGAEWLSTRRKVRSDSAISVIWALGMAIGVLFIFLTPGYVPELQSFLFGNILTITPADLAIFAGFVALLLFLLAKYFRPIAICAFDSDFARTIGMPVALVNGMMTVLTAICIVLTLKLIGIMLLMSLFTVPQMTAELFTFRLRPMMALAAAIGVVSATAGLFASYFMDIPASATIVITQIIIYAVARNCCGKRQ